MLNLIFCTDCRTVCSFRLEEDVTVMTPNVKRWDMIFRISVLLAIGCMVTAGGCSKSPGGLLTVEIAEKFLADNDSVDLSQFT